jgi:hypothetical protein
MTEAGERDRFAALVGGDLERNAVAVGHRATSQPQFCLYERSRVTERATGGKKH